MSIFHKLFLLLACLVIVPLGVVTFILIQNTGRLKNDLTEQVDLTGDVVSNKSEFALLRQVERTHLKIVQEKAGKLESFFEDIRAAVLLEGTLIQQYLTGDAPAAAPYPIYTADQINELKTNDASFRAEVFEQKPYTMYNLIKGMTLEQARDILHRLRQLGGFFAHSFEVVPGCALAYLGHRDGVIFGYPGGSKFNPEYDPRKRPWYIAASEKKGLIWTPVYVDRGDNDLIVTCATPVYDPADGSLLAVAAMDVRLIELVNELFAVGDMHVSEAMLVDDEGKVRVSARYVGGKAEFDRQTLLNPPKVADFQDVGLRATYPKMVGEAGIIEGSAEANEESLYIFATVRFRSSGLHDAPAAAPDPAAAVPAPSTVGRGAWRYVLKVPLVVIEPARQIRASVSGATDQMRVTMEKDVLRLAGVVGGIATVATAVALALAAFFAGTATKPLIQMEGIAQKIAVGDFNQNVEVRSRDEIGRLGKAINQMIVGLKERDFIKGTFKRYVTASVVEELLKDPAKLRLGGEKKDLTIFFSDLSGFTSLSEHMPAEKVVELLNEYLGAMTDAVLAQEGTLDKYIGDAVMAFWGAPLAKPDDALRACRTAMEQLHRLKKLWIDWDRRGLPRLEMRIGLQTGPVIVGNIGSDIQMNYTVIGDTANTSSRLEGANKFYGTRILMGEATRQAAGDGIVAREIDLIAVKGKTDAVRVYELLGMAGEVPADQLAGYRAFEAGLAAYRAENWNGAEAKFREAMAILGDDPPSKVFLKRVEAFRRGPPAENWDGSFSPGEK